MSGALFILIMSELSWVPLPFLLFQGFSTWSLHRVTELLIWWLKAIRGCVPRGRKCELRHGIQEEWIYLPEHISPVG